MAVIIYPELTDWFFMKQRPQQLMEQLGKLGHKVFFINTKPIEKEYYEVKKNVYLVTDTAQFIRNTLRKMEKTQTVIVWCTWPKLYKHIMKFHPDKIVYDCCDEFPEWLRYEKRMVKISDLVVCSAQTIYDRLSILYPKKPLHLIRNGADESFFKDEFMERPTDMPIKGPIVGYAGAWAYWADNDLIEKLCEKFPDVNFVFIGEVFSQKPATHRGNLFFLGHKSHHELSNYLYFFNIGIIPFRYHPVTLGTNPIKAYEYLAKGLPVLSTALPECIEMEPYITTATTHEDFIQKLEKMLQEDQTREMCKKRKEFARKNSWEQRGMSINEILKDF